MSASPDPCPFHQRLRLATRKAHARAEKSAFIQGFLRGVVSVENYFLLLRDLHAIYDAMELAQRSLTQHPVVGPLVFSELFRAPSLERDLNFFGGPEWPSETEPSAAAQRYVARIEEVASGCPNLLAGHLYTRYLGDLSGGRILARIAANSLGLTGPGLEFYDFPEIPSIAEFKALYRSRLDHIGTLSEVVQQAVVEEANLAFRLNVEVFETLDGSAWPSLWRNCRAFVGLPQPHAKSGRAA